MTNKDEMSKQLFDENVEAALIEKAALSAGMKSLMHQGAASCVYSEGCNGVTQEHLIRFAREIALHCAVALSRPAEGDGWIRVEERLPEAGRPVLLDVGERHPVRAMYAAKHTLQADPEMAEDLCDYSEQHGEYYAHEGWYELNSESETLWRMRTPIRWHEIPSLPPPPTAGSGEKE